MAYTQHEDDAEQIKGPYRWRHFDDENIFDGTAQEAASAMRLDPAEVEWACEEFGRCDTAYQDEEGVEQIVCWQPGPIVYGTDEEPIQGGFEWPAIEAPTDEEYENSWAGTQPTTGENQ